MPPLPFSPEVDAFLLEAHPAVVGRFRPTGPRTGRHLVRLGGRLVLLNMDESRARLGTCDAIRACR